MNIEDMIYNGASEEEIMNAIAKVQQEKARQEEALRKAQAAKEEEAAQIAKKEALKAEGRAYLINAIIAYLTAFDLLPEDYDFTQEEIDETETLLKAFEEKVPLYIKLFGLDKKIEAILNGEEPEDDMPFGLGLGFGGWI